MHIKSAFGKNLLVEPFVKSQILVAEKVSMCEYGTVIAKGSLVKEIEIGDIIGFKSWGVSQLDIEDKVYYFVPESDDFVLGKLEND